MASTYIGRTQGTPTNSKKWTISYWAKYNVTNGDWYPTFGCDYDIGDSYFGIGSGGLGRNEIGFLEYHTSATNYGQGYSDFSLRDASAWYHIVFAYDSTQGTAADRGKTYINGVQATNTYSTNIPQDHDSRFNMSGSAISIGRRMRGPQYMDGVLSHFHFVDGTAYDPTPFGETDSTTGEWKIKTDVTGVNYGNNGFFVLKDGNSLTDESPNTNNFTLGNGTLTKTEDNPSNVFAVCTKEPIRTVSGTQVQPVLSNGRTTWDATGVQAGASVTLSSLGAKTGKYYMEAKVGGSYAGHSRIGVGTFDGYNGTTFFNQTSSNYVAYTANGEKHIAGSTSSYGASYTAGDIISVALDCDNNTVTFYKNGASQGAVNITNDDNYKHFSLGGYDNAGNITNWICNFGNGYFGTTAVSSAGTNASGIGIFEYDVPTGYTALCTKGLNE